MSKASVDNDLLDIDGDGSEIRDDVDFGLAFDTLPTITRLRKDPNAWPWPRLFSMKMIAGISKCPQIEN